MPLRKQAVRALSRNASSPAPSMDLLFKEAIKTLDAKTLPLDYRPNDMVGWSRLHFRIPRDEQEDMMLKIAPYQEKALNHAYSRDANGLFNYDIILWGDIKKSIKSTLAAAGVLWRAFHVDYGQFFIAANTREQADSRVFYYITRAIELNPNLKSTCTINRSTHTIELSNHAKIEAISGNSAGEAGGDPTMVEMTEAWGATGKDALRLWTETTLPPARYGRSQRLLDTYAGFEGESELLWQLYETGVLNGEKFDPEYDFFYRNKAARMFSIWNTRPRLPWQTPAYYESQRQILTPSEYLRVHENTWSSASNAFVPAAWWEACRGNVPAYTGEPCVGAIDAAVVDDCFAVVVLSKIKGEDRYAVRYSRKWSAPLGGKIDFDEPEAEIRRLSKEMNVIQWTYDEYQLASLTSRLSKEGVSYFYAFSQGAKRLVADKRLFDSVRDRRILHSGEPSLTEHILNANASTITGNIDQLRLIKRSQSLKIDLAVALSMALAEATGFNLP